MVSRSAHRVRIADEAEFALSLLHDEIDDGTDNTPTICQIDIHLDGEISRLVPLSTEDNMSVIVFRACTRDVSARSGQTYA